MNTQIVVSNNTDNLNLALAAIDNAPKLQDSTKHQYRKAILNAYEAGVNLTDAQALTEYAKTIGSSTRSFLSAVINLMTAQIEKDAKMQANPENVLAVQAIIYRAQVLRDSVETKTHKGHKAHTWLSQREVKELLLACNVRKSGNPEFSIIAQRDRLAIGLCVGAGLRREEAVNLKFEDMITQPMGDGIRYVLNVTGKGAKDRVVPISDNLAQAILEWGKVIGTDGYILRSLGRDKQPGKQMTATALYNLVQKRGAIAGKENLQPHDLRRTFAQIGYDAGIPIAQISILLGHSNIETTMKYLNIELDLSVTISDFVPFS